MEGGTGGISCCVVPFFLLLCEVGSKIPGKILYLLFNGELVP
jgi:hypothetical protein